MTRQTTYLSVLLSALFVLALLGPATMLQAEPISGAEEPAAAAANQSPELKEAISLFQNRDLPGALKQLKIVAEKDPDSPPAEVIMAQFCSQAKAAPLVRNFLERAVKESPDDPEAYLIMGEVALQEEQWTEAELLILKAQSLLEKFSKSQKRKDNMGPRISNGLAMIAEAREDWPEAQKQLEGWLKQDPKSALAMQRLAHCLFMQKNVDDALAKLKEAVKADKQALTAEAMLAQYYEQAKDPENAKKWMTAALAAAPKDLQTYLVATRWAIRTNQLPEAAKYATTAMEIDPKSLDAKFLRGVVALFQKDYPAAERYFEAAHLQSPSAFEASNYLARALIEQKDDSKKKRALEYAENNVRQNQKNPEAASTYGWVLYKMGRVEDAERALEMAAQAPNVNPDTYYYLAKVLVERGGKEQQAKQLLEGALQNPSAFTMRPEAQELLNKLNK